jgi:hypothetical protein
MRSGVRVIGIATLLLGPYTVAAASSTSVDRISVTGDWASLSGTSGGGGGTLTWLHNFDPDSLVTLAGEHQKLGPTHWSFGSLSGAVTRTIGDGRYTFSGEAHEGSGVDGLHPFKYHIEAAAVTGTYFHRLSTMLEYRYIDVETTHGHLPKFQLSYLWTPHWLTTVSYAVSAGGNLGTRLTSVRVDHYSPVVNLLGGGTYGQASATVINVFINAPGNILREGFIGASKTFARRTDVTLTGDFQDLSGTKRTTVTLGFIVRLGSLGAQH